MSRIANITRADVSEDDRLSFDVAAALAFPDGSVNADKLRRAARAGQLEFARVGNKHYTSLAAIKRAFPICLAPAREPASTFDAGRMQSRILSSVMEAGKSSRDAVLETAKRLKRHSKPISAPNSKPNSGTVIRAKFPSSTSSTSTDGREPQ